MRRGVAAAWFVSVATSTVSLHAQERDPIEIDVQGSTPRARPVTEASLSGARARSQAGTQDDAVKAVQNLTGFARGGASSEIIAWGASPQDSRIVIDGVEIPRLYHGSALRGVVPSELVESINASPGAYDARFGRGIGGLVRIHTKSPDVVDRRLVLAADLLDASALVSTPVQKGSSALSASGRVSYVDRWLPSLVDGELRGSLYAIPAYWDAQAEYSHTFANGSNLRLSALTAWDSATNTIPSSDPARTRAEERRARFGRVYAVYGGRHEDGSETRVTPYVGWDASHFLSSTGDVRTALDVDALRYGLRASQRARLRPWLLYELGIDVDGTSADVRRLGSLAIPRREGDPYPFGMAPTGGVVDDAYHANAVQIAPYLGTELALGPLSLQPALRVETVLYEASRSRPSVPGVPDLGVTTLEVLWEPRLAVLLRLSKRATLVAVGGRYHQLPRVEDLGAYAGNPRLDPARSTHYSLGERVDFTRDFHLEVRAFYRDARDVTRRNPEPRPRLAETLLSNGQARAYGAELSLRVRELLGFEGWGSLSLSRSEVRISRRQGYRLSDWDSPLTLTVLLSRALGAWQFSGRARLASGNPRTPVAPGLVDVSDGSVVPSFGRTNSVRLPHFFQLDLRVDRAFELGPETTLHAYLDLLNVTARRNPEEIVYSADYAAQDTITGLPPMAVLGLRLER